MEAMNELLKSLDPSIKPDDPDITMASDVDGSGMDRDPRAQPSEPESEDDVQPAPAGDPSHIQPLAGALEDNVPTVKVDKKGRAYLTQSEVIFPKHDEV